MYDYALGGKDNYRADRETAEMIHDALPTALVAVRENRTFMRRAVRHLLALGVRQFLDLGCGMPGRGNVHDLVQRADPSGTVVYVDNDPVIVNHYQALLSSSTTVSAVHADLREPGEILASPAVERLIDLRHPVGVLAIAVLHYLTDADDPAACVRAFTDVGPGGSHLVLSHYNPAGLPPEERSLTEDIAGSIGVHLAKRSPAEIETLFAGLELVAPGLVPPTQWRPDRPQRRPTGWLLAGVARKP